VIVAAAIQLPYQDPYRPEVKDLILFVPRPGRHHNALHGLFAQHKPGAQRTDHSYNAEVQGFITETGEFLDRRAALIHARACGQPLLRKHGEGYQGDELFSEDLW